ncbi:MAG: autotransporter domain-containing protein, partial [Akkermansia sp.]
ASVNGYIDAGKIWVVRNTDGATITGGNSITEIEVGGETKTLTKDDSGWYFTGDLAEDPGAYYVNSGVVLYQGDTADGQGGIADATTLKLNGGTLKMTSSLTDQVTGGIQVIKTSVIDLSGEDVVLKKSELTFGSGASLLLRGDGIYDIGSDTSTGVTLVSGENGWTGTIAISDVALGGPIAWNNFVNGTLSTLQLTSVRGWIAQNSTVAANLRLLKGTGTTAGFTITGVNDGAFYSFSGKISGDGDLEMSQTDTRTATYNLQGDCSEWTGNFLLSNLGSGTATVNYTGSSVIGNGFVNASAATMNVFINKDDEAVTLQGAISKEGSGDLNATLSGSSVKTLQQAVTATSLTVNGGSATLEDTLTVDTLTANADTTLNGSDNIIGSLEGTGNLVSTASTEITNALSGAVEVEVKSGSLVLAAGMADGNGGVKVCDGATLELRGNTSSGAGTISLDSGAQLINGGNVELSGNVTGSGSLLVKQDTSLTIKGNVTLGKTIVNNGSLSVEDGGSISFDSVLGLDGRDLAYSDPIASGSVNGYASGAFTVVKVEDPNENTSTSLSKVILEGTEYDVSVNDDNSAYIVTKQPTGGLYYICSGTVNYGDVDVDGNPLNAAASDNTTGLVLNGGNLRMLDELNEKAVQGISVEQNATISVANGVAVDNIALNVKDGVKLTLDSDGDSLELDAINGNGKVSSGKDLLVDRGGDFTGTYEGVDGNPVRIGTSDEAAHQRLRADANLTVIGNAGTVELTGLNDPDAANNVLGGISTTGATVKLDNVTADGSLVTTVTLGRESSMDGGVLEFTVSAKDVNTNLAVDKDDKPTVITGEKVDLKNVTLKINEVDNTGITYNSSGPEKDVILFVVSDNEDSSVDNVTLDLGGCTWMTKYFTNFRVKQGSIYVVADANTSRYAAYGLTRNGTAGLALAGKAMFHLDPQTRTPGSELAQVLDMLDNHITSGNTGAMDKLGAALAGSSLSAVGLALADDVQRQLRSIRNRTTTMGVNQCEVNEDMPYVNGWISGDGNYRQLSESGTDSGYQVSSWGGTVGVDVDVNPNLTLGVAVSALFGDYTGKAADTLTGDLDTQYVSLFARVSTGSWVNTFVGTLGRADVDLERTIPGIAGKTTYKTNGMMFGFLYEVARTFALNDDATTCVQPLFNMSFSHTTLDSATEGGTADTRLATDSASLTQFSLGFGGRLQSIVGENEYNRASIFEARALLKLDFGDRYNKLNTALAVLPTATVTTRSNEKGVVGAEIGATLTIPLSQDAGSIFFDVNADFNADEVGVNGSVGYRVNF